MVENQKKVDRHLVGKLRNLLGIAMMYMFFTTIARSGKKGAGGKPGMMPGQTKSKKFLQPVNVRFNDVVGMQKAK